MTSVENVIQRLDAVLRECDELKIACKQLKRELTGEKDTTPKNGQGVMKKWSPRYEGFGLLLSGPAWSALSGIPRNTLWRRLKKGMTIEEIYAERGLPAPPTE
jgi:transcriptional regulator of acetoin/glycerol metabolism